LRRGLDHLGTRVSQDGVERPRVLGVPVTGSGTGTTGPPPLGPPRGCGRTASPTPRLGDGSPLGHGRGEWRPRGRRTPTPAAATWCRR
jgi:hypothetical protein